MWFIAQVLGRGPKLPNRDWISPKRLRITDADRHGLGLAQSDFGAEESRIPRAGPGVLFYSLGPLLAPTGDP
jgi:hypothetical protein